MKESISSRIRRIITGTASSIVSRIEDLAPEVVLEQAIAEVDGALGEVKAELGQVTAQKHHVTKAIAKLNQEHSRLDEQLSEARKQGREDLLEVAVSRQIDIEDQLPALENQLAGLGEQQRELDEAITGLVAKRNEMEDELFEFRQTLKEQASAAEAPTAAAGAEGSAFERAERADHAFSRVIQHSTGVRRGAIHASSADSAKLIELANLNKKARVDARLRQLREQE